ncbi:putative lipid II flippase FtsW [Methyloglobulus sp.]|uniref:putative lipid II flippase FtsW n=1 Tax=Methyloglobulus sp. TaxID=2518622 RepID=UPI0039892D26
MNGRTNLQKQKFHFDPLLVAVTVSLLFIGYVMVASSSLHLGLELKQDSFHYPAKQLAHIVLGLGLAAGVTRIPMESWEKIGPGLFIAGLFLLVIVFIPGLGVRVNGALRWLSIGGIRIQVSEVVKLFAVIYMAGYVTRHQDNLQGSSYGIIKPLLLFSVACVLLLREPDYGSAVVIMMIAMGAMFLGGARLAQFISLLSVLVVLGVIVALKEDYRIARLLSFIDPFKYQQKEGYQLTQALIAFGRGEWLGVGLGSGIQKLFYLPEAHTDFLFSVIGEELGLLGVVTVIVLYTLLIWRTFTVAVAAEQEGQRFSAFVAYGLGVWLGFQSFVNMGVNMGILPTKGLTLPLMSYGGSSMIVMCCALALLFKVHSETVALNVQTPKERST